MNNMRRMAIPSRLCEKEYGIMAPSMTAYSSDVSNVLSLKQ